MATMEVGERPVYREEELWCPRCGARAKVGYGLMGGGIGGYEFCSRETCPWFHKTLDEDES